MITNFRAWRSDEFSPGWERYYDWLQAREHWFELVRVEETKRLNRNPPVSGEYLLYLFLSKKDSEAVAGDLEERWRKIKKKFGVRRANFWYWTQVVRSLWPFGVAAAKRVSGLLAVIEAWRKLRG